MQPSSCRCGSNVNINYCNCLVAGCGRPRTEGSGTAWESPMSSSGRLRLDDCQDDGRIVRCLMVIFSVWSGGLVTAILGGSQFRYESIQSIWQQRVDEC